MVYDEEAAVLTKEERVLVGVLVAVALGAAVVAGVAFHWPLWVTGCVLVILLLVPFQVRRSLVYRSEQRELRQQALAQQQKQALAQQQQQALAQQQQQQQQQALAQQQQSLSSGQSLAELEAAHTPSPPPQYQRETLPQVPLRSAMAEYDFLLSATVYWRTLPDRKSVV